MRDRSVPRFDLVGREAVLGGWPADLIEAASGRGTRGWLVLTSDRCLFARTIGRLGGRRLETPARWQAPLATIRRLEIRTFDVRVGYGDLYRVPGVAIDGTAFRLDRESSAEQILERIRSAREPTPVGSGGGTSAAPKMVLDPGSGSRGPAGPELLTDGTIDLVLYASAPADPVRGWVPALKYHVTLHGRPDPIGDIQLRVGRSEALLTSGNVGYSIEPPHRGHRYAARACRLLGPVAVSLGVAPLVITCAPENVASRRTLELLGARLLGTYPVPPDHDMFSRERPEVLRFEWDPSTDLPRLSE